MSQSKALINLIIKAVAIGSPPLMMAFNSYALDSERVDQLEKEIREIKLRVTRLESSRGISNTNQEPVISGDAWKALSNWRQLKTDMNPEDVRKILGEPSRINGGGVAFWFYPNGGTVTFMQEKLYRWTEPSKN